MRRQRAADAAKTLLNDASRRLLTHNPSDLPEMSDALEESLDWQLGRHAPSHPHGPFEPAFSETRGNALGFQVAPGDGYVTPGEQVDMATRAMRAVIAADLGPDARYYFDQRTEPFRANDFALSTGYGANFSAAVDRNGIVEAAASYGWPAELTGHFPDTVVEMARIASEALPGLRPFYTTIRAGRSAGGQQITFDITRDVTFAELRPLMDAFGMGARHAGLTTVGAFVLGARYSLPAHSAALTLMRSGREVEMRIDIDLDALPDAPPILLPLLRLPMAERPSGLQAFDRWLTALTPEGYTGPGSVTVLSIRVRPNMPARLAVFLRPIAFDAESDDGATEAAQSEEFAAADMPMRGNAR